MNLKTLKFKKMTREELKAINAGTLPDCEPGKIGHHNGTEWVCVPSGFCSWEIPNDGETTPGDNSANDW
ncbi:hypothetical protein THALO_440004 [Tenacibaculum halocynthiae]